MRPSQAFQVLETLRKSSSVTLSRKGVELSFNDTQTVLDVYQQWLLLMLDLGYLPPETLLRDAQRLWSDMIKVDVLDLNNAFAECVHLVRVHSCKGFKGLCAVVSSHLYHHISSDIQMMTSGDVVSAGRLIQLFSYTGRLSLNDIDLTQQMLDSYMECEDKIPNTYPRNITSTLNKIVKSWFGAFQPDSIVPHHGPGGVAGLGRCSLENKYSDLTSDQLLCYAFGEPWWVWKKIPSNLDRISQTIFVPKSYKSFRTISMEPATLQYFQQGIWETIEDQVNSKPYLRNHIGFNDQTRNQQLAKEGSINRNFATIDLSSASDSVGYELVKQVFKGTWLLRYIVATRSHTTLLPDGRYVKLRKFAPMGSSLCFPIETIIFASLCEHVTRVRHLTGQYSVFGDDIIVPTQCVDSVMRLLEVLGFRVNHEKSFSSQDCWFRESCGGEYCDGYDVTPMRVSRSYASRERLVRVTKLIELANNAYKRNYRFLRIFFLTKLRSYGYKPLFAPTEVLSWNYTNFHVRHRWNLKLQRIDCKVSTLLSRPLARDLRRQDESIRYHHWLEATAKRKTLGDGYEAVICRTMTVVKETWRAKPYEVLDQDLIDSHVKGENNPLS